MRLFAGGRHLGWEAYSIDTLNGYDHRVDTDGWGFLIGAEGAVAIAHRVKMIGGIEASFLAVDVHTRTSPAAFATNGTLDRGLMSAGGHLGLDFALSPNFSLSAGYRGTGYWGIEPTMGIHVQGGVLFAPGIGRGAVIDHGPFARLNFSFGN